MNRRMFVGLIAAAGVAGSRSFKVEARSVQLERLTFLACWKSRVCPV